MFTHLFRRSGDTGLLVVGMMGVKLGERVAQMGCVDGGRLGAIAKKVGLSGRTVAIVPDEASAARALRGAAEAGALVEIETAPPTNVPLDEGAFDLVVVDDTAGLMGSMREDDRSALVGEALRILRPGGRAMVIGSTPPSWLRAFLMRTPSGPACDAAPVLQAGGFKSVRVLAERAGLIFVEGIKAR